MRVADVRRALLEIVGSPVFITVRYYGPNSTFLDRVFGAINGSAGREQRYGGLVSSVTPTCVCLTNAFPVASSNALTGEWTPVSEPATGPSSSVAHPVAIPFATFTIADVVEVDAVPTECWPVMLQPLPTPSESVTTASQAMTTFLLRVAIRRFLVQFLHDVISFPATNKVPAAVSPSLEDLQRDVAVWAEGFARGPTDQPFTQCVAGVTSAFAVLIQQPEKLADLVASEFKSMKPTLLACGPRPRRAIVDEDDEGPSSPGHRREQLTEHLTLRIQLLEAKAKQIRRTTVAWKIGAALLATVGLPMLIFWYFLQFSVGMTIVTGVFSYAWWIDFVAANLILLAAVHCVVFDHRATERGARVRQTVLEILPVVLLIPVFLFSVSILRDGSALTSSRETLEPYFLRMVATQPNSTCLFMQRYSCAGYSARCSQVDSTTGAVVRSNRGDCLHNCPFIITQRQLLGPSWVPEDTCNQPFEREVRLTACFFLALAIIAFHFVALRPVLQRVANYHFNVRHTEILRRLEQAREPV